MKRSALLFVATSVLALGAPSPAAADSAHDALARHAAYVGHPDSMVLAYRVVPAAKASPSPVPSQASSPEPDFGPSEQATYRRGLLYHETDRSEGVSTESGFDGRAYWTSNENRYTVALFEEAQRRAITVNAVDAGTFDDTTGVQARGTQTLDGTQYDVVRVTPRGGIAADVAIDRAGAFGQVTYDPDDRYNRVVVRIVGYTEIAPGVRVPTTYRYDRERTSTLLRGTVRTVTNAELQRPAAPTAVWTFGNGDPVRFDIQRGAWLGRAMIVHASINGKPGTFLFDSGASQVLLYRPYADGLGLTMLGKTSFSGVNGGTRDARFARAASIAIGDNTLSNVVVAISSRDPDQRRGTIDGILGFDVLAGALVHVDLVKETMEFADPAQMMAAVPKGGYAFSVNLSDGTPEIRVKVGAVTTLATFDTGDDYNVILSENLTRTGRVVGLVDSTMFFGGVDGIANEPASCYYLHEIMVGPFRYQNTLTCFGSERVFGRDGGLIGFDFLRHFDWTFDYARSRLILAPNGR